MATTDKNRLNRIVTRSGDDGTTGLADGTRLTKDSPRIIALGAIDELNASIGLIGSIMPSTDPYQSLLTEIQQSLFDVGGCLCFPANAKPTDDNKAYSDAQDKKLKNAVLSLEQHIAVINKDLPPLKEFILPGGTELVARTHFARTVCRRAERDLVHLSLSDTLAESITIYINRLSDLLFVLARVLATAADQKEILWNAQRHS